MTDVNAALLERVLRYVTEHPIAHRQDAWAVRGPNCGTACCLAGWTVLLLGHDLQWESDSFEHRDRYVDGESAERLADGTWIDDVAAEALGLTVEEGGRLFDGDNTLDDLWRVAEELTDGAVRRAASAST